MELEQALNRIKELEAKIDQFSKNESNQNSYITSLEKEKKDLADTIETIKKTANNPTPSLDPKLQAYIQKKLTAEMVEEGIENIVNSYTKPVFELLKKDFDKFIKDNMTDKNASVDFVEGAFTFVLGQAIKVQDHPVRALLAGAPQQNDPAPLPPQPTPPPVMTDDNKGHGQQGGMPPQKTVRNTNDAFGALKQRLNSLNTNNF